MSILSGFKMIERYIKQSSGYQKISQWTSSRSVEFDDGTNLEDKMISVDDSIELKAPSESPTLTGIPIAPTASAGTNTEQIATTEFVQTAIEQKDIILPVDPVTPPAEVGAMWISTK